MQTKFAHFLMATIVMAAVLFCSPMGAQTITADVGGTVTDATGLVVGQAKVTATNIATNVALTTTTNSQGIYSIRFLQIGQYTITVEVQGFQKTSVGPFTLESGQVAKIDTKLTVGETSSVVNVSGTFAPLLNTENGTLDTVIDSNTIGNMPLNGANFSSITLFLPGSVETNPSGFTGSNAIERSTGGSGQASINGGRNQQNNYLLDGVEINETINNTIGYNPSPDALEEVRVISANAPAEFGNVNGGDILMVTKSGTNGWHGSASMALENYLLDANTWANKHYAAGPSAFIAKAPYTQTIFGGTFGGPIKKDKLFFFVDFLADRYHSGGQGSYSVLSAAMRSGDFSELLNPAIMCSSTGGVCAKQSSLIQLYDSENNFVPYPNNKIPISNPVYQYLVANPSIYPLPNHALGANSPILNNYAGATTTHRYNEQGDVKIDYTPTKVDRYSVRYTQGQAGDASTNPILTAFPGANTFPDKGVAINWVREITPALINEFRAGFTRIRWQSGIPTDPSGKFGNTGNSKVGIPGTQPFVGFAAQSTYNSLSNIGTSGGATQIIDNTFSYSDDLTWQRGKHLLKAGVQLLRYQQNQFYAGNDGAMGTFYYGRDFQNNSLNFTNSPAVIAANNSALPSGGGYSVADFALNRVSAEGVGGVTGNTGQRQWRSAYFLQDDFKLTSTLTLNLGMRYEFDQPIYEINDKQANVLPGGIVEFAGKVPANAPAGSIVCPTRACYNADYGDFAPRIGFAYQVRPTLVVRGGYGLTDYLEGTGANLRLFYNPPFEPSLELTGSSPSTTGGGTYYSVTNGFNAGGATLNTGGTTYRQWQQNIKAAVIGEYSLTTEYQVNNFTSFKLGYIGESGQHLILAGAGNQLTRPCYVNGVISSKPTQDPSCILSDPAPYQSLVGQAGAIVATEARGMMNYNALQATYRQRATKGLEYTVNYSFGRAMTNTVGFFGVPSISGASAYAQNYYNNHAEYGPVGQDVRHNLNGTAVYALPFGRGREYGANVNRFVDLAIGGWKSALTAIVYSGFPVTISANQLYAFVANRAERADQVTNARFTKHSVTNWWGGDSDTQTIQSKYAAPAAGTFGNAAVGSERGPGYQQYDMSFFKDFTVFHEERLGFRADLFNAFNIASLGNPGRTQGATDFGLITSVRSPQRQIQFALHYQF